MEKSNKSMWFFWVKFLARFENQALFTITGLNQRNLIIFWRIWKGDEIFNISYALQDFMSSKITNTCDFIIALASLSE